MTTSIFDSASGIKLLRSNLNLNDQAKVLTGTDNPTVVAKDAPVSSIYLQQGGGTGVVYVKNDSGSTTNWTAIGTTSATTPSNTTNYSLQTSVAASAMTVALKTQAGSDPSGGSPVNVSFRSATLATGDYTVISRTSALSVVIPSGATMGQVSGQAAWIYCYAINNAGTMELAVTGTPVNTEDRVSTTALSGSSDSNNVLYSTSARTNVAARFLGKILNSQATAGTWASNSTQIALKNDDLRVRQYYSATKTTSSSNSPAVNTFVILDTAHTVVVSRTGWYQLGFRGALFMSDTGPTSRTVMSAQFGTSTTAGTGLIGNAFSAVVNLGDISPFDSTGASAGNFLTEPIFIPASTNIYLNTKWNQNSGTAGTVTLAIEGTADYPSYIYAQEYSG